MSIALATSRIGTYTSEIDRLTGEIADMQSEQIDVEVEKVEAGDDKDKKKVVAKKSKDIRKRLALATAQQGVLKEFVDFWKNYITQFLSMIKSLQELSQGAR